MRRFMAVFTLALAMVGVFLIAGNDQAQARNDILSSFVSRYAVSSKLNSCMTCHAGSSPSKSNLNPYGSALAAAGVNFAAIEGADSDGDGASNLTEIKAGTYPGDAKDKPTTTTTTSTTTTSTTAATVTPTSTTTTTAAQDSAPKATAAVTPVAALSDPSSTEYQVGDAGSVWLVIRDGVLVVTDVVTNTSWTYSMETEDGEIEIEFRSGDSEIEFEAELEDGVISAKVEQEDDDANEHHDGDAEHRDGGDDDHGGDHGGDNHGSDND